MNLQLSPVVAGTMSWGAWDKKFTSGEMSNLIRVFTENKITTFDHADIYGNYTTESEFGKAFKQSGISRDKIQLISKCGIQYVSPGNNNRIKHYDYSKKHIVQSAENSLKNLQTDYLDVFLLHRPSPLMVADEIAEAIIQLKKEGKIRAFGLSNFTPFQSELIRQKIDISFNQIQFSVTQHEAMTNGSLDYLQLHNITPMAWNPLGTVFREDTEQTRRLKRCLAGMMDKYGMGSDLILLAWIKQHPAGIIPVAGTANSGRIQQLYKAVELKMDVEDWFEIWTESMGNRVP
ncbi:MAG: aldo/keto reductase [Candidatus Kapabacteria bacterium]|jgi:predicted oxidoreductase|nr:aldo/keto reductase [Candidatus Kapabacteria bacterium]